MRLLFNLCFFILLSMFGQLICDESKSNDSTTDKKTDVKADKKAEEESNTKKQEEQKQKDVKKEQNNNIGEAQKKEKKTDSAKSNGSSSSTKVAVKSDTNKTDASIKIMDDIDSVTFKDSAIGTININDLEKHLIRNAEIQSDDHVTVATKQKIRERLSNADRRKMEFLQLIMTNAYKSAMKNDKDYNNSVLVKSTIETYRNSYKKIKLITDEIAKIYGPKTINKSSSGKYKITSTEEGDCKTALSNIEKKYKQHCEKLNNKTVKFSYMMMFIDKNNDLEKIQQLADLFVEKNEKKTLIEKMKSIFGLGIKSKKKKAIKQCKEMYKEIYDDFKKSTQNKINDNIINKYFPNKVDVYVDDIENTQLHKIFSENLKNSDGIYLLPPREIGGRKIYTAICIYDVQSVPCREFKSLSDKEDLEGSEISALSRYRERFAQEVVDDFEKQYYFIIVDSDGKEHKVYSSDCINNDKLNTLLSNVNIDISKLQNIVNNEEVRTDVDNAEKSDTKDKSKDNKADKANAKLIQDTDEYKNFEQSIKIKYFVGDKEYHKNITDLLKDVSGINLLDMQDKIKEIIVSENNQFKRTIILSALESISKDITNKLFDKSSNSKDAKFMKNMEERVKAVMAMQYGQLRLVRASRDAENTCGGNKKRLNEKKQVTLFMTLRAIVVDDSSSSDSNVLQPTSFAKSLKEGNFAEQPGYEKDELASMSIDVYRKDGKIVAFSLNEVSKDDVGQKLWNDIVNSSSAAPRLHKDFIIADEELCKLLFDDTQELLGKKIAVYVSEYRKVPETDAFKYRVQKATIDNYLHGFILNEIKSINNIDVTKLDKRVVEYIFGGSGIAGS